MIMVVVPVVETSAASILGLEAVTSRMSVAAATMVRAARACMLAPGKIHLLDLAVLAEAGVCYLALHLK